MDCMKLNAQNAEPGAAPNVIRLRFAGKSMIDTPSTARMAGNLLYPLLASVPSAAFTAALVTDVAYWESANMQWANFSAWLLAGGLVVAVFAILVGLIDFTADRRIRELDIAWTYAAGNAVAVVLAILNSFVHSRDAYTSVVPLGLILSGATVVVLMITGWMGWELIFHYRAGLSGDRR
jgi:uncharacterized membrane protein